MGPFRDVNGIGLFKPRRTPSNTSIRSESRRPRKCKTSILHLASRRVESLSANDRIIRRSKDGNSAKHDRGPVHLRQRWVCVCRKPCQPVSYKAFGRFLEGRIKTYTESTVTGSTHIKAMMLMTSPDRPRVNRSRGIGSPIKRRQMALKTVIEYENVKATLTSDTIALKPATSPKLMQERMNESVTVVQTERRGVSRSRTYAIIKSAAKHSSRGCGVKPTGSRKLAKGSPPSRANDHSCLLAVATSLINAEKKQRMIGTPIMTVAALLFVELRKSWTNGV